MIRIICQIKGVKKMVIDMLQTCKERKREIEKTFYKMLNYSNDMPTLEKLADEMIAMEILIIRMEKHKFDTCSEYEHAN